jgi:hypothetical protein
MSLAREISENSCLCHTNQCVDTTWCGWDSSLQILGEPTVTRITRISIDVSEDVNKFDMIAVNSGNRSLKPAIVKTISLQKPSFKNRLTNFQV